MSNPFDQFSADVGAALPSATGGDPNPYGGPPMGMPPPPPPPPTYGHASPPAAYEAYGQPPPMPNYGQSYEEPAAPMQPPPEMYAATPSGQYGEQGVGADQNPFDSFAADPPVPGVVETNSSYGGFAGASAEAPFGSSGQEAFQPPPPPQEFSPPAPSQPSYADPWGAAPPAAQPVQSSNDSYYSAHTQQQQPPPPPPQPYGMPPAPPTSQPYGTPHGPPQAYQQHPQQPSMDPNSLALVPSQQQSNPYAQPMPYGGGQQQPYGADSGYGQQPPQQQHHQYQMVPAPPPVDPFSVFESAPAPAAYDQTAMVPVPPTLLAATTTMTTTSTMTAPGPAGGGDDDFWNNFSSPSQAADASNSNQDSASVATGVTTEEKKSEEGLPEGGEWYDARIFTPTLGVMFFKPQELTDSLFLNTDKSLVDSLGQRPVVAFIVEGSSARSAGVELGHVLVKVNGQDVHSPKEASRLIKEGPRPLPLLFYVPSTDVVTAEGEHMVKYDTKETVAPNSAKEWKPKYVVIGGIIAQPWMMNMYRSKSEYDIAVIETQARRPVSVKVKQFSLQGARIQNDWQGPQMVKYKNKIHPWKYIVVLPVARNPIKISSPNLSQLKPVHEGIRRVLLAQQRGRSGGNNSAGPTRSRNAEYHRGGDGDRASSQRQNDGERSQRSVGSGGNNSQRSVPPPQQEQPDLISQDILGVSAPPPPPQQSNGSYHAGGYLSAGGYAQPPPPPPPHHQLLQHQQGQVQPPYQQQQPGMPHPYHQQQQPPPPHGQPGYPPQGPPPPQQQQMVVAGFYGPTGTDQYNASGYGPPQPAMPPHQQPQQQPVSYPPQQYGY